MAINLTKGQTIDLRKDGNDLDQITIGLKGYSAPASYKGIERKRPFGRVDNAYIRAVDGKGKEMVRYPLSSEPAFDGKCTMVLGEVYRHGGGRKFRAIGDAYPNDSFVYLLKSHIQK